MTAPDDLSLVRALDEMARFIGRAVGVSGDLDALEAISLVKAEIARLQSRIERLEEALRGMEEACPDCGGSGYLTDGECAWCGATGTVMKPVTEIAEIVRAALPPESEGGEA